jgi:hypothetical protein
VLPVILVLGGCAIVLASCGTTISNERARSELEQSAATPPVPAAFNYCYGHGCKHVAATNLNVVEWGEIRGRFDPPASDAVEERKNLAIAVGRFENYVGEKLRTKNDRGGTFQAYGGYRQLDCVDEATNTTTLLRMLEHEGHLKWHRVSWPVSRGIFVTGWPHSTATIEEIQNQRQFAVDSWFFDNGEDAVVVPYDAWVAGWVPE